MIAAFGVGCSSNSAATGLGSDASPDTATSSGGEAGAEDSASNGGTPDAGAPRMDAEIGTPDAAVADAVAEDAGPAFTGKVTITNGTNGNIGTVWNDTSGTPIQAHSGGFLKVGNTYYWVGEDKTTDTGGTGFFYAISLYSSKDLFTWDHVNKIVTTSTDPALANTDQNLIIERPKIIYNASTKMYVMWAHWDMESCPGASCGYCDSEAVVFKSPTVDGNYTYVGHFQPGGHGSRDCTLWQEDDGTAYFISNGAGPACNDSWNDMWVYPLSSDYLSVANSPAPTNIWPGHAREAPAFWKVNGTYYGVSSQMTGWAPNQAAYTSAPAMLGPWDDTFTNIGNNTTWGGQSTYVIPVVGSQATTYIFAADLWNSGALNTSQYLWLPLVLNGSTWTMNYSAQWTLDFGTGDWSAN